MSDTCERAQRLVAGRRAGEISLRQFKAKIELFSDEELACLAAALLETTPARRKRLQQVLLAYCEKDTGLRSIQKRVCDGASESAE